jgi:hypothetical protein
MDGKKNMNSQRNIIRLTIGPKHHFFGFHDLPTWNFDDNKILCLEVDKINRPPLLGEEAGVGYVDENGIYRKIGYTQAYNFPQGARMQWIGKSNQFIVNNIRNNSFVSDIYDAEINKMIATYDFPCHQITKNGNFAFSINYSRLHRLGGYGYQGVEDFTKSEAIPTNDGIYIGVSTLLDIVNARQVTVLRDGQEVVIPIPENFMNELMAAKEGFATYRFPTVVAEVQEGSGAAKAGLRSGDSLVAINGVPTPTFIDFKRELEKNKNREITIEFYRNGILNTTVAQVDSTGLLGFYPKSPMQIYQPVTISYNFFEAFPAGIKMGIQTLKDYVNQFKYVFTKEGVSSLGGFGTIGSLFPPVWDWHAFWMMTAFLSVILAFMNILPIPGLDGGHVLFLLCEVISGKKPSEKFLEYAQIAGMIFLLALVLYANGMDIIRAIFK